MKILRWLSNAIIHPSIYIYYYFHTTNTLGESDVLQCISDIVATFGHALVAKISEGNCIRISVSNIEAGASILCRYGRNYQRGIP